MCKEPPLTPQAEEVYSVLSDMMGPPTRGRRSRTPRPGPRNRKRRKRKSYPKQRNVSHVD